MHLKCYQRFYFKNFSLGKRCNNLGIIQSNLLSRFYFGVRHSSDINWRLDEKNSLVKAFDIVFSVIMLLAIFGGMVVGEMI